jgi:hypothetical protein
MHCTAHPAGGGVFWYSATAEVHWSRVSKVLGSTTMPPCGPATTKYQTKAIVGDMKSSHGKRVIKSRLRT